MNVLDILLLVAAVWFAIVGYRQGFVVGILSVIGFLGAASSPSTCCRSSGARSPTTPR